MEIRSENNILIPLVYAGSVWLACKSLTELNKVLANQNSGSLVIGLNLGITIISWQFVGEMTKRILK